MLPGDEEGVNDSKKCCDEKAFTHSGGISNWIFEQQSNLDATDTKEGSRFSEGTSRKHRSTQVTNHVESDPKVSPAWCAFSSCGRKPMPRKSKNKAASYDTSNGLGLRVPWPHPIAVPACTSPAGTSPAGICPVSPWTPADFSQPPKELHVQRRGPVRYCQRWTARRRRKTRVVRSQARVLRLLIRALE